MNIIEQYATSHDLPISEVEEVAIYIDPLNSTEFESELEAIKVIDNTRLDQMFNDMIAEYLFTKMQKSLDILSV